MKVALVRMGCRKKMGSGVSIDLLLISRVQQLADARFGDGEPADHKGGMREPAPQFALAQPAPFTGEAHNAGAVGRSAHWPLRYGHSRWDIRGINQ